VWCLTLLLLTFGVSARAESAREAGVRVTPRPEWVAPLAPADSIPEASGGVAVLGLQFELRRAAGQSTRYFRRVVRVVTEAGARLAGEQRFAFTPPYERLLLHAISVRRGDVTVQALELEALQILQRETGLDAGLYSGERTALALVPDIRVGDVIDCEYSVSGENPVLAGHLSSRWQLQFSSAVGQLQYRALSDRVLNVRAFGGAQPPEPRRVGSFVEYRLELKAVKAMLVEESLPPEYELFPWVQLSDFASWREVAAWGQQLFQRPPASPQLRQVAREVTLAATTPEERVTALLQFVQQSIRYTSLSFAESSHRPAEPDLVLKRRFGDCKDKSLLLVKLLEALEIEARVALVSSYGGERVAGMLPTTSAFDHVIVAVELGGKRYFVDPTRNYQRGNLEERSNQPFGRALVLGDQGEGLAEIVNPRDVRPQIHAYLRYDIARFGEPVKLLTTVTYRGGKAEAVRALRASGSIEAFDKVLASAVTATHSDAKLIGNADFRDSLLENQVVVQQFFSLEKPWQLSKDGRKMLTFFPPWLRDQLPAPPAERVHPLAIEHPRSVTLAIEAYGPGLVGELGSSDSVAMAAYELDFKETLRDGKLSLDYDFRTLSSRIEPERFAAYREAASSSSRMIDVSFVEPPRLVPAEKFWVWVLGTLAIAGALAGLVLVERHQPYLKRPRVRRDPALARRAGWLALLALAVTIAPLRHLLNVATLVAVFEAQTWTPLTAPASALYRPWYAAFATAETIGCLVVLVLSLYCTYLFWATRRSFPLLFVVTTALSLLLSIVDEVAGRALASASSEGGASALLQWPVMLAWMGYAVGSRRMASLFVPDPEMRPFYEQQDDSEPTSQVPRERDGSP
jgi:transglutaminase-like putative cysteine protease